MPGDWLSTERMEEVEQYVIDLLKRHGCTGFPEAWHNIEGMLADTITFYKGDIEYRITIQAGFNDKIGFTACSRDLKYIVVEKIWIPYASGWKGIVKQLVQPFGTGSDPRVHSKPTFLTVAEMESMYDIKHNIPVSLSFDWGAFGIGAAFGISIGAIAAKYLSG